MQGNWIGALGSTLLERLCEPTSLNGLRSQIEPKWRMSAFGGCQPLFLDFPLCWSPQTRSMVMATRRGRRIDTHRTASRVVVGR